LVEVVSKSAAPSMLALSAAHRALPRFAGALGLAAAALAIAPAAGCERADGLANGAGCGACSGDCAYTLGTCAAAGRVCDADHFVETGTAGETCDGTRASLQGNVVVALMSGTVNVTINDFALMADVVGGTVALEADPMCMASTSAPCRDSVIAIELSLSGFTFDGRPWSNGVVRVDGPFGAADDGEGIDASSGPPFAASFVVDGNKTVVAQATAQSIVVQGAESTTASIVVTGSLSFTFGGYTVSLGIVGSGARP
jgi:hypothetical protein